MRERETTQFIHRWLVPRLIEFVRLGNFADYEDHIPFYRDIPSEAGEFDPSSLEINIIRPVKPHEGIYETPEKILSILFNGNIRKGNLTLMDRYRDYFIDRIEKRVTKAEPINIVLPTLPFKDQNPLTTRLPLDAVDLGEYLFMAQLRDIIESVKRVYPPGLRFTILTDGLVYADIFANGDREKIKAYRENCSAVRDVLGLTDVIVRMLDMGVVVMNEPRFFEIQQDIKNVLVRQRQDQRVRERMKSLRWGMLVNIPSLGYDYNDFKEFLKMPEEKLPRDILERVTETSLNYASFALAMSILDCIKEQFPDDLRATVHPKNAPQIPIHLINKNTVVFPYNGVPVVAEGRLLRTGSLRKSAKIVRYCDVLQYPEARAVFLPGGDNPFYYLVSEHKKLE